MSRRNIILIVTFIATIMVMMVAGNVIIVAQKIAQAIGWAPVEYIIYAILLGLFAYIFLTPIVLIHSTPALPALSVQPGENIASLRALASSLSKSMEYIADPNIRRQHTDAFVRRVAMAGNNQANISAAIEAEIDCRFNGLDIAGTKGINQLITSWAASTFMITTVSQNGKFDTISIIYLNFRMIADIVRAAGFRPSKRQLFKLYTNVLVTSLMTFVLSGALDNVGDLTPFDNLDEDAAADAATDAALDDDTAFSSYAILKGIKIPGVVIGSALDGAANALMTLRIGYITASYLRQGASAFKGMAAKRSIKRQAMKDAVVSLPSVIVAGSSVVGKTATNVLLKIFKKT